MLPIRSSARYLGAARSIVVRPIAARGLQTEASAAGEQSPPPTDADGVEVRKGLRTIETMPFQTFQLALGIIKKDQKEKHALILQQREKLRELKAKGCDTSDRRFISIKQHIEKLRILADSNNPRVKYNFDCGVGEASSSANPQLSLTWLIASVFSFSESISRDTQADIPASLEQEMEGPESANSYATSRTNEHFSRCPPQDYSYRRFTSSVPAEEGPARGNSGLPFDGGTPNF